MNCKTLFLYQLLTQSWKLGIFSCYFNLLEWFEKGNHVTASICDFQGKLLTFHTVVKDKKGLDVYKLPGFLHSWRLKEQSVFVFLGAFPPPQTTNIYGSTKVIDFLLLTRLWWVYQQTMPEWWYLFRWSQWIFLYM